MYRLIAMGTLEELIYMRQLCAPPHAVPMAASSACLAEFYCMRWLCVLMRTLLPASTLF